MNTHLWSNVVEPFSESRSSIHQVSVELLKGEEGEEEEEEEIGKSGLEVLHSTACFTQYDRIE